MKAMLTKKVSDGENLTQPSLPGQEKQEDFCGRLGPALLGQRKSDAELRRRVHYSPSAALYIVGLRHVLFRFPRKTYDEAANVRSSLARIRL